MFLRPSIWKRRYNMLKRHKIGTLDATFKKPPVWIFMALTMCHWYIGLVCRLWLNSIWNKTIPRAFSHDVFKSIVSSFKIYKVIWGIQALFGAFWLKYLYILPDYIYYYWYQGFRLSWNYIRILTAHIYSLNRQIGHQWLCNEVPDCTITNGLSVCSDCKYVQ